MADDEIYGFEGNDSLTGKDGNDILRPGAGVDTIYGDNGTDTLSYSDLSAGVFVYFSFIAGSGSATSVGKADLFYGIEMVEGTDYADYFFGDTANDNMSGGAGSDMFYMFDGLDTVDGGDGIDTISYESYTYIGGIDVTMSAYGAGIVLDAAFGDTFVNTEIVVGTAYSDMFHGGVGLDAFQTGGGNDKAWGGSGNDVLRGDGGNDQIHGDGGDDQLFGGLGYDKIWSGNGHDSIYGDGGVDKIWGEGGNDQIFGGGGNDEIVGGGGDDQLTGEIGDDSLTGSAGFDFFIFNANDGTDRVNDFENNIDTLFFNSNIWAGAALTVAQVISTYASVQTNYSGIGCDLRPKYPPA